MSCTDESKGTVHFAAGRAGRSMDADLTDGAAAATARERVFPQRLGEPARSMLEAVLKGRNLEAVAAKFDTRKK